MPMPFWRFSRRARARSAAMVRPGVSSMYSGRLCSSPAARASWRNSCWLILPHAQILGADPRLLGEDARGELVGRHFEAEHRDRRAGRFARLDAVLGVAQEALRGGESDVGRQRALAHARPPGDDDQVGAVQAADLGVQAVEPGGDPGQMAAAVERPLGHLDRQLGRFAERLGLALGAALLGDLVELGLGSSRSGPAGRLPRWCRARFRPGRGPTPISARSSARS